MLSYSEQWAVMGQSPYIGANLYPPLTAILFTPLLGLPYRSAYAVITFLSLGCFFALTLFLPLDAGRPRRLSPLLMLVVALGLLSYGMQFELERGQFNLIAMTSCLSGIWIFHRHPKARLLAYALISLAIQLKLYPLVFIVFMVDDWRAWGSNLKRVLGLALFNVGLFFVLGMEVFNDFLRGIWVQVRDPNIWIGNHSIASFVDMLFLSEEGPQWMSGTWLQANTTALKMGLLILISICMALVLLHSIQRNQQGLDLYLLLAFTLGALVIPSVSHDYTLSVLSAPVALLFHTVPFSDQIRDRRRGPFLLLVLLFSFAYGSTLFSYTNKPLTLANNLPALVVMLLITTIWAWMGED